MNAKRLHSTLVDGLKTGSINENSPISGKKIAERAARALGFKVTDEEVRQWVHYLRAKLKVPIGSNNEGYFLCAYKAQWLKTQKALIARIANQREAAYGPDEYYHKAEQQSLFSQPAVVEAIPSAVLIGDDIINHPVIQALKDQFGAVPI